VRQANKDLLLSIALRWCWLLEWAGLHGAIAPDPNPLQTATEQFSGLTPPRDFRQNLRFIYSGLIFHAEVQQRI
jgi:hypothetical protein